jgi:hypothetical protein
MNPRPMLVPVVMLCAGLLSRPPHASAQAPDPDAKPRTASIIITNAPPNGEKGKAKLPFLSMGLADVIKLQQAGVEESVLLAFVQSANVAYHPSAKEVIYLREQGLTQNVIAAMLRRGGELRDRAADVEREERFRALPPQQAPAPASNAPPNAGTPEGYPQTQPTAVAPPEAAYSTEGYAESPAYSYSYASYPAYPYAGYGSWRYCGYPYYGYPYYGYYGCYPYSSYSYCSPYIGVGFSIGYGYGGCYSG